MGSTRVKRGDVWWVNLDPTIGHEIKKKRPAVIIQNDIGNKHSPITIIAPITTQNISNAFPVEVLLTEEDNIEGKVLLNQIRAIDKKRLIKKESSLSQDTINYVNNAIKISLALE